MEEEEDRRRDEGERRREREHRRHKEQEEERSRAEDGALKELERKSSKSDSVESRAGEGEQEGEVQHRLEETSASLAAALEAVEHQIKEEDTQNE